MSKQNKKTVSPPPKILNFNSSKGFTLAEILISLLILGVIASLTIPSLIQKYNKSAMETSLKKQISVWSNAFNMAINSTGESLSEWHLDTITDDPGMAYVKKYLAPYLSITEYIRGEGGSGNQYTIYNARGEEINDYDYFSFCLADGSCAHFESHTIGSSTVGPYGYGLIEIDLNGRQGPNCWGKDVFMLNIYPDKSGHGIVLGNYTDYPDVDSSERRSKQKNLCYNDPNWGMLGRWCTGVFIDNGYKFPDDYPWL